MADEFDAVIKKDEPDEFDKVLGVNQTIPKKPPADWGSFLKEGFQKNLKMTPEYLATLGSMAGSVVPGVGTVIGAGLGSTTGIELQNEFPDTFGKPPDNLVSLLGRVGLDTAGGIIPHADAVPSVVKGAASEMASVPLVPRGTQGLAGLFLRSAVAKAFGIPYHDALLAAEGSRYVMPAIRGGKKGYEAYKAGKVALLPRPDVNISEEPFNLTPPEGPSATPPEQIDLFNPQSPKPQMSPAETAKRIKDAMRRISEGQ